jgi:hypothetical protein
MHIKKCGLFLSVLFLVMGTALFVGCDSTLGGTESAGAELSVGRSVPALNPDVGPIAGSWTSDWGELFQIDNTKHIFTYSYSGHIVFHGLILDVILDNPKDSTEGIVYIQYTTAPYGVVGNYYAIRWTDYKDSVSPETIELSACSDSNGQSTLAEAEALYTVANADTYFEYSSDCERVSSTRLLAKPAKFGEKPPYIKYLEEKTGIITFLIN